MITVKNCFPQSTSQRRQSLFLCITPSFRRDDSLGFKIYKGFLKFYQFRLFCIFWLKSGEIVISCPWNSVLLSFQAAWRIFSLSLISTKVTSIVFLEGVPLSWFWVSISQHQSIQETSSFSGTSRIADCHFSRKSTRSFLSVPEEDTKIYPHWGSGLNTGLFLRISALWTGIIWFILTDICLAFMQKAFVPESLICAVNQNFPTSTQTSSTH